MHPRRFKELRRTPVVISLALGAALLASTLLLPLHSADADAARFDAESATCQGTVDSDHTGFSGAGFCNTYNQVGAYVEWTVTAAQAGTATLSFRHANGSSANRPLDITVDGQSAKSGLAFPSTGAWTSWATVTTTVTLPAGTSRVRAAATTSGGAPNLDYLDVDAKSAATVHQAEDATISRGQVDSDHAGFTGSGFVNYDNVAGSYVEFTVTGAAAGSATLSFRYANGTSANRPMTITVNGSVAASNLAFNPTGAWASWQTSTATVTLTAGSNKVRATAVGAAGGPNLDKVTIGGGPSPSPTPTTPPTTGDTPADINGQLRVCGVKLCNEHGNPIQLRGMSSHGLQWYHQCLPDAAVDALAKDWNADVMRISMYIQEGGYESNPRLYTDRVHALIEKATARGMYAIIDWHMLTPGDPYYNLERAKTFFTEIAQRHNSKTNLLYEIANEPSGVSWARIKGYAEELIPVIRRNDPETPILVGTRGWSSLGLSEGGSETEVIDNQVNASNILYVFHFYAASHRDSYLAALSRAADRIPMFVTEFGTQDYTGDGGNDFTMSQRYLDLMASKKISWANWNYSDDHRSGAVFKSGTCPDGPYAGTTSLKPAGVWIRDRIRTPDNFPTT